mmetsp:Transcript_16649/g.38155  ORF Transcript_16649/g.38155 Transcript_16649/m.38155 type:complete len:807 (+) Transcript_16649:281-2701(+)
MPNHIKRATERTKSMCGCKTCTVFIDMFQNLLLWRTKFVKSLELKLSAMPDGRDKVDFETKFDEYKAHIAKDGSAWSAAQRIACDRLVVEEMDNDKFPHFSCVLNQCSKCPDWSDVIHEFERNSDLPFRFSIFSKHARCLVKEHSDRFIDFDETRKQHFCLKCKIERKDEWRKEKEKKKKADEKNASSKKRKTTEAEEEEENEDIDISTLPKLKYKEVRTKKTMPMKEFMEEKGLYEQWMHEMHYHITHVKMLGARVCARRVEEEVKSNRFYILFKRDHTERYTGRPNEETQSEGMGHVEDVSIEGAWLLYKPDGDTHYREVMYFHISDEKAQNGATVKANLWHSLQDLDERGEIPMDKLQAIFDIVDGSSVQYRCGQVLHSMTTIAEKTRSKYYRIVQCPGHGKCVVDGECGRAKTRCDLVFSQVPLKAEEESENRLRLDISKVEDGKKVSQAENVFKILIDWEFSKPAHKRKLQERRPHLRHPDDTLHRNTKMIAGPFESGWHMGMGGHYNFIGDWELKEEVAARRIPCSCQGCRNRLKKPIAERYKGPCKECIFWKIFKIDEDRGWNDYRILSFTPDKNSNKFDEEEYQDLLMHTMRGIAHMVARDVRVGGYGAYPGLPPEDPSKPRHKQDDGFVLYFVRWTCKPWQVVEDEVITVDGEEVQLRKGEWVCKGKWLYDVPRARHWYFHEPEGDEVVVRMGQVLSADIDMAPLDDSNPLPRMPESVRRQVTPKNPIKLSLDEYDWLMDEMDRRERFNVEEVIDSESDESDSEDDSDDDESGSGEAESDESEMESESEIEEEIESE